VDDARTSPIWIAELYGAARTGDWIEALLGRHGILCGGMTWGAWYELSVVNEKDVERALDLVRRATKKCGCYSVFRFVEQDGRRYQPVAEFELARGAEGRENRIRGVLGRESLDAFVECDSWRGVVYATPATTTAILAALRACDDRESIRVYQPLVPPLEQADTGNREDSKES
jgi:hypothetical protein